MGKMLKKNYLRRGGATRPIVAVSLVTALAAFGCTTNRATPLPPPMTSSYTRVEALPAPSAKLVRRSGDAAAAILAGRAVVRGRYLGTVNPGTTTRGYVSDLAPSNRIDDPALRTNPQLTVNSSISSQPTAVVQSGAGAGTSAGGILVTSGTTGAVVVPGTAATTAGAIVTPTAAALGLPAGTFAATAPSPTAAAALNPTVTAASSTTLLGTTAATTRTGVATTTGTTANSTVTGAGSAVSTGGVRILRSNGTVTVTNVDGGKG